MRLWVQGVALHGAALLLFAQSAALVEKSERAKLWMAQGRFAEAAGLYAELTKAVPGNPGLLLNQGMALHMAGQDAAAIAPLEAAMRIQALPPALLFLGGSYLRTGQAGKALAPLERFAAVEPEHREARQMLVDAATGAGRPDRAVVHLRKLAEWEPERPSIWYSLGREYRELAAEHMAKLPEDSGYWLALAADTRNRRSQTRARFLLYRKSLEKAPRLRGVHASLAEIYRQTGHDDWAKVEEGRELPACKAAAVTLDCSSDRTAVLASPLATFEARYWKARAAGALADEAFAKLAVLPESVDLRRHRAETARDEGRHREAAEQWRAALALAPRDAGLELELAGSLVQAKEYEAAQEIAARLLAADPQAPDANFLQGDLLLQQQKAETAIPYLAAAVKADARVLPARAALGRALMLAGRGAEAVPHLEAALPLDTDASLHFQLARAYQAAGKAEAAKAAMAKYQALRARAEEDRQKIEAAAEITAPPAAK